jgi:hypothetical protein
VSAGFLVALIWMLALCGVSAGTYVWTGLDSLDNHRWNSISNWSPCSVPGAGDAIIITNGSPAMPDWTFADLRVGGSAYVSGPFTVGGSLRWESGNLGGTITNAGGATLSLATSGAKWLWAGVVNHGTIRWQDGGWVFAGGRIENQSDGVLDLQVDGTISYYGSTCWINNAGWIRKTGGTNLFKLPEGIVFTNSGLVSAESGGLEFQWGFASSGVFDVSSNATVRLQGGTFQFNAGHRFQGAGHYGVTGPATLNGTITEPNFQMDGNLYGQPAIAGTLQWNNGAIWGNPTVTANGVLNLRSSAVKWMIGGLTNLGRINWLDGGWAFWGGGVVNQTGGLMDVPHDGGFAFYGGAPWIVNAGILRKSGGTGALIVQSGLSVTNTGTVTVQSGTIRFEGAYSQTGGHLSATLRSATNHGGIFIAGAFRPTGSLDVTLDGGYQPVTGDSFKVLTCGSITGAFDALGLPSLPSPLYWSGIYGAAQFTLAVNGLNPVLSLAQSGGALSFNWTTNLGGGYLLERATNLNPSILWTRITNESVVVGGRYRILLPVDGPCGFYRLEK